MKLWKNQRTIRTYVVPENPRTPKQMANRNKFSASVPFAQKGMSMNYRSPAFASETTTEWALRMSSAKYAMDLGLSDVAAIPVVPRGFTSAYTITEITLESVIDATHAKLSLVGTLPAGSKSYSLMIYFSDGTRAGEYMLCEGITDASDNTSLTVTCENTATLQTATVYGVIVSKDDIDAQTVTYSAKVEIKKESRPAFAMQITNVTKTATTQGKLHITVETSFLGNNLVGTFSASDVLLSGDRKTKEAVFTAGGEEAAATEAFEDNAATISGFTINKTTGVIEFDITPSNVQTTQSYEGVFVTFQINWENAYTDETTMSSSFASSSSGWAGGHLQAGFTLGGWELDYIYSDMDISPSYDLQHHWLGYCTAGVQPNAYLTADEAALQALLSLYERDRGVKLSATQMGTVTMESDEGDTYTSSQFNGGDWTFDEVDGPVYADISVRFNLPEERIVCESGSITATTVRLLNSSNARFGVFDSNHIWTAIPELSFSGNLEN